MENELRPFWNRIFRFDWKFGLVLTLAVCVTRFALVMNANATANYKYIGLIMAVSAVIPFIFLGKYGRKQAGIVKPVRFKRLIIAFITGLGASFLLYFLGKLLFGDTYQNWYMYIGKSYNIPARIDAHNKAIMFSVMAVTGMIFSPIGEEFFFRGIVHAGFAKSIGEKKASIVDSSAFALTHLSHFGLVFIGGKWIFYAIPSVIWVLCMFMTGLLFVAFKKYSESIWGAVLCHAAFNLGMIYCIFYLL